MKHIEYIHLKPYPLKSGVSYDDKGDYPIQCLTYQTEKQIKELGGYCLTRNQYYPENYSGEKLGDDKLHFHGIALLKEKTPMGQKWFLHLMPGGGYCEFKEEHFDELMPMVIKKLNHIPDYRSRAVGRHSGDTVKAFKAWQKKEKNLKLKELN